MQIKESYFYEKLDNNRVRCLLCPHNCLLDEGQIGLCKARKNIEGRLYSLNYGEITALNLDPIEKKPLFHFYPSSKIISVGTWGCNLKCQWCQNWEISQVEQPGRYIPPEDLLKIQRDNEDSSIGIAFTYSEPTVFFDYIKDFLNLKYDNLKVVLVTNGYINLKQLSSIIDKIDAFNIDIKGFNDSTLRKFTSSSLDSIEDVIKYVYGKSHLELTTLVVPGVNDDENEFLDQCVWIESISKDIPLHISRYYPNYKFNAPPTPLETLKRFYEIAKSHLNFVYVGNSPSLELGNTYCPYCGSLMIERTGYEIKFVNYEKGRCTKCGKTVIENTF
jgi:pyruvate formate lyase activating enzyme